MENQIKNFLSLKAEFHDKGKAGRGFKNIMNFIDRNNDKGLKHLLRFHGQEAVYQDELMQRFEFDALLEYYNLSLVAIFSGYIPSKFDTKTSQEIQDILSHPSVKPYYETHYKDEMVAYVLKFIQTNSVFEQNPNATSISAFNAFISLNRFLKRDTDIEQFLGMLDHVSYGGDDIADVNKILSSYELLHKTFTTKDEDKSIADGAVWGFMKYAFFLSQLKGILLGISQFPLLQSAIWLFYGYYFSRLEIEMKSIFDTAFSNLEKTLSNPDVFKNISQEVYQESVDKSEQNFDEKMLNEYATLLIRQARADVSFVLDSKWALPLRNYFQ